MSSENPIGETSRLNIRLWREHEARDLFELTHDAGFLLFPITDWRQNSVESARDWILKTKTHFVETKTGVFALEKKEDGSLIGIGALRLLKLEKEDRFEITYRLRSSAWNRGFATEAANCLLEYGFRSLNLKEIAASITPGNQASIKVAQKLGMKWTNTETLLGVQAKIYRVKRDIYLPRRA